MGRGTKWSKEEIDYLIDKWGVVGRETIAKNLNRTEYAIMNKVHRLGLGRFIDASEYLTVRQLFLALGYNNFDSYKITSWVNNRNLPIKNKLIKQQKIKIIHLDDFWKWAEQNKNFLDFSNFQRYALGKEPKWVEEKRQNDVIKNSKYKMTPWTAKEDEYLIFLLKQFKYSYKEISEMTHRTVGGISRRISDLGLKERPIKAYNHNKWTDEELELLDQLILKGVGYQIISEKIGRSSRAVAGVVYRKYGTENLDKAMKKLLSR